MHIILCACVFYVPHHIFTYCITGKYGAELNLADQPTYCQIKFHHNFFRAYIRMMLLYHAAKLKSTYITESYVWDQTAKFNFRQIFWLYGSEYIPLTDVLSLLKNSLAIVHVITNYIYTKNYETSIQKAS